jgi:hypothetical protein
MLGGEACKRKMYDLPANGILHSLDEDEEMAAEIVMAVADAEEAHTGVLQRVEATEKAGGGLQPARKRHRRDTIVPWPVVAAVPSDVGLDTAMAAKRPRR